MSQSQSHSVTRIYLFGSLQIHSEDGTLSLKGEKSRSLLAHLILHPRVVHRRELLANMLWPDAEPERVRRNLSDVLYRLQKEIEPHWLTVDMESISFQPNENLWVDVWEFDRLIAGHNINDLRGAVELYTGNLLPELYDDWVVAERELRHSKYLSTLERLANKLEGEGKLQEALLLVRRLILSEPLHEPAHQAYLRLLGRLRRFGEALAHYDYLCELLRSELDSKPATETSAIIETMVRERDLEDVSPMEETRPFIGRKMERATALTVVETMLSGNGSLLSVEGEAGIGKSRFLREVAAGARWRGATVLHGQSSEIPGESPFAPLIDALSPLLAGPRGKQIETMIAPEMLALLTPIHPAWGATRTDDEVPIDQTRKHFYNALNLLGEALTQFSPVVLILDDMHWADAIMWESLRALVPGFVKHGGLIILAYRRPGIETQPCWEFIQGWDREGILKSITLGPFNVEEAAQYIGNVDDIDPAVVHAWAGGNPFYIDEWLAAPASERSTQSASISSRLQSLPSAARSALESASVLGESLPYRLLSEISGLPSPILAGLCDDLTMSHWLQPSAAGYEFVHDLLRASIYGQIESSQRRALHERAAHAYRTFEPDNLRARAFHLDQAGLIAEAANAYRLAGEQDLARFAFREARQALDRALMLLPESPTIERIATSLKLAEACEITGDPQRRRSALEVALAGARHLEDSAWMLQVLLAAGKMKGSAAETAEAKSHFLEALALARASKDQPGELQAIFELGYVESQQGQWKEAQKYYNQALELAQAISDTLRTDRSAKKAAAVKSMIQRIRTRIHNSLALQIGALPEAVQHHEEELITYRRSGDRLNELSTQMRLLGAYYNLCAWDRLLKVAGEALALAESLGDLGRAATAQHVLGLASYALGDTVTARQQFMQAEKIYLEAGLPRNAGLSRNTLGLVAEDEGHYEEALDHYRAALAGAEVRQTALEAAYARHDLGALLLRLDKPLEAIPLLDAARAAWSEQDNNFLRAKSESFLGLALLAAGERTRAKELANAGWDMFGKGVPDGEQPQGWLWALHRLLMALDQPGQAQEVLRAAYVELQRQAQNISDLVLRQKFFERVPLNRDIVKAHDELTGMLRTITVSLVRKDVPLGRALREADYVTVQCTLSAPEDESIPSKSARRLHRLRRLLEEAARQGAAPTDNDMAQALGVSRRTILRDMQEIAKESPSPPTRKRKR